MPELHGQTAVLKNLLRMCASADFLLGASIAVFGFILFNTNAFGSGFYRLQELIAPEMVWAVFYIVLGAVRVVLPTLHLREVVITRARVVLCGISFWTAWVPLTLSFWWFAVEFFLNHNGALLPGIVLAPIAANREWNLFKIYYQMWQLYRKTGAMLKYE